MIALEWTAAGPDLARTAQGGLATDAGLRTAVLLSLFLDRRAGVEDPLPDPGEGRRGWVGDALAEDRIGSRLWLLAREKQLAAVPARAEAYAREALAWLLEDGVATTLDVSAAWQGIGLLALSVRIAPQGFAETFVVRP